MEVIPPRTPPAAGTIPRVARLRRPKVAWTVGLVLLGVAVAYTRYERTEVYLTDYAIPLSYLDGRTEVVLEGAPTESSRRLLADVRPGLHVLHYDVGDGVRYYAELPVERGENRIRPEWMESRLPALYRSVAVGQSPIVAERTESYFFYDHHNRRVEHEARLAIYLAVETEPTDPTRLLSTLSWSVTLDGASVADRTRSFRTKIESADPVEEHVDLYADDFHSYWIDARFVRRYAHLELGSGFAR